MHRLVTKLGLPKRIDASLSLLKVHLPYHESDHVLNIAYNVLCGGTRLEDIERLRTDGAYMNALGAQLIPDPTTAGDFCRRFSERDIVELMACINAVRSSLWASRGRKLLGDITYIDVDAQTCRRMASARRVWTSLTRASLPSAGDLTGQHEGSALPGQPTGECAQPHRCGTLDRRGHRPGAAPRQGICVRGDTDFFLTRHLDRWAKSVDFIFGMDANAAMRSRAEALDEAQWQPLQRKPRYHTVTDQKRKRNQPHEKQRIVDKRAYANLVLNHNTWPSSTTNPRGKRG